MRDEEERTGSPIADTIARNASPFPDKHIDGKVIAAIIAKTRQHWRREGDASSAPHSLRWVGCTSAYFLADTDEAD